MNPRTRLINIITELDDPYGAGADDGAPMAPGLFVTAKVNGTHIDGLLKAPRGAIRSGNKIFLGDVQAGELRIREVDVVHTDPEGAWFRSDVVGVGDLAITSPLQAPFDGMSIVVLERQKDGTILTHEPQEDAEADTPGAISSSTAETVLTSAQEH